MRDEVRAALEAVRKERAKRGRISPYEAFDGDIEEMLLARVDIVEIHGALRLLGVDRSIQALYTYIKRRPAREAAKARIQAMAIHGGKQVALSLQANSAHKDTHHKDPRGAAIGAAVRRELVKPGVAIEQSSKTPAASVDALSLKFEKTPGDSVEEQIAKLGKSYGPWVDGMISKIIEFHNENLRQYQPGVREQFSGALLNLEGLDRASWLKKFAVLKAARSKGDITQSRKTDYEVELVSMNVPDDEFKASPALTILAFSKDDVLATRKVEEHIGSILRGAGAYINHEINVAYRKNR